jgi:hypothetical protein
LQRRDSNRRDGTPDRSLARPGYRSIVDGAAGCHAHLHARPHCGSTVHHWRRRRLLLSSLDSRSDVRLLEIGDSDADAELLPLDSGAVGPESLVFSGDRDGHACASYTGLSSSLAQLTVGSPALQVLPRLCVMEYVLVKLS